MKARGVWPRACLSLRSASDEEVHGDHSRTGGPADDRPAEPGEEDLCGAFRLAEQHVDPNPADQGREDDTGTVPLSLVLLWLR